MNAGAFILFFLAAFVAVVLGFPAANDDDHQLDRLQIKVAEEVEDILSSEEEETGLRVRRATCDLLSVNTPFGSLNHAACAAHCLSKRKGYKGGRCRDGVCHCRK